MKKTAALLTMIALAAGLLTAGIDLEKAARIDMNPTAAINSDGQVIYAGVGGALNIYNIYQRDFPQLVGTVEGHHSNIKSIIVDANRLYVLWEKEGLEIFDITDYYRPYPIGKFPVYEDPEFKRFTDMDLDNGVMYLTGADFVASLDVSRPHEPFLLNSVSLNGAPVKIDFHNNKIYIAAGDLGLGVLFVANPKQFFFTGVQKGIYTTVKGYENIVVYGRLDERDPNEPSIIGKHLFSFPFPSPTVVKAYDNILYAGGLQHFAIYRMVDGSTDPQIVWKLGNMPTLDCVLRDDVVYLANSHRGLSAYLVMDIESPVEIGRIETYDVPQRAALVGDDLFVAAGVSGVLHYNIAMAKYPILLDTLAYERLRSVWDVKSFDGDIYILGARDGSFENIFVERYRMNGDWVAEYPVARVDRLDPIGELAFGDGYCAVSLGRPGISILPMVDGAILGGGYRIENRSVQFCDLIIENNILYAGDYWGGYHIFQLGDGIPEKLSYILTSSNGGNGIALVDNFLLAADGPNGLAIIDVSVPESPIHLASYASTWGTDIAIDGDYAFLSDGQSALKVYDISALPEVELVAELPDNGYWNHVYVDGDKLVGIDRFYGVYVYDILREEIALAKESKLELPAEPAISMAYPNPFNAEATIAFTIPEQMQVDLSIFDITGRRQATLISDRLPEGSYNLRWRPGGAPSGTYFAVLTTPGKQTSKKLLLVK